MQGVITVNTLSREFAAAGIYINDELLGDILQYATDTLGETTITFKQFKKLMDSLTLETGENPTRDNYTPELPNSDFARAVKLGFDAFDKDEDGKLSHQDIKETLTEHAYSGAAVTFDKASALSPQELAMHVYAIDKPNTETISRQAMFNACTKHRSVFLGKDSSNDG
mgnify:CR=1 FL=1